MASFVQAIQSHMSKPLEHAGHYYWVLGVQSWASLKNANNAFGWAYPPELGDYIRAKTGGSIVRSYFRLLAYARRLDARKLKLPVWHYQWLDYRLVQEWLKARQKYPHERNLVICSENSPLAQGFPSLPNFSVKLGAGEIRRRSSLCASNGGGSTEEAYDSLLLHTNRANLRQAGKIFADAQKRAKPNASISIFVDHPGGESDPTNFSVELSQYVNEIFPADWTKYKVTAKFVGGRMKRRLHNAERRVLPYLWPSSTLRLPLLMVFLVSWPVLASLTAINNLIHRHASERCPEFCSSFMLTFSRLPESRQTVTSKVRSFVPGTQTLKLLGMAIGMQLQHDD
jgi:hypothetical protein